ncbi:MAG: hypothetical protein ACR2RE_14380 [Geminicoccaceae bacterium]
MSNLPRSLCVGEDPTRQERSHRIFTPENASLAQGLLQILLEEAHIEVFSPEGGGVALMRLERWQIDLLQCYGIAFGHVSTASQELPLTPSQAPSLQSEYIDFDLNLPSSSTWTFPLLSNASRPSDILSDWLID